MESNPVNCGRCAHLWNREKNHPGFGRCACNARQRETGIVRELVDLSSTCEHATLSAKFDPNFMPNLRAQRRGEWETAEATEPAVPAATHGNDFL